MSIEIKTPGKEQSCFEYEIVREGFAVSSYLTYEYNVGNLKRRNLLLVKQPGSSNLLSNNEENEYRRFFQYMSFQTRGKSGQTIERTKRIVNEIISGNIQFPNARVAIHRFGPVPVFVLPQKHKVDFSYGENLEKIEVQIAIYADVYEHPKPRVGYGIPYFVSSGTEFLESLEINFARLVRRYFEDIGEHLGDISSNLSRLEVFSRSRKLEEDLATSIKTKVDKAKPGPQDLYNFFSGNKVNDKYRCEFFEKHQDLVFLAEYFRIFTLYFLNELYKRLGVADYAKKYSDDIENIYLEYSGFLPGKFSKKEVRKRLRQVKLLDAALECYRNDSLTNWPTLNEDDQHWLNQLVSFAKFVWSIKEIDVQVERGRIFISHNHDVFEAEQLRNQIEAYVDSEFGKEIKIYYSKQQPPFHLLKIFKERFGFLTCLRLLF